MLKRISNEMQCSENSTPVRTNQHNPNGKRVTIVQLYLYENTKQSMKVKTALKGNLSTEIGSSLIKPKWVFFALSFPVERQ